MGVGAADDGVALGLGLSVGEADGEGVTEAEAEAVADGLAAPLLSAPPSGVQPERATRAAVIREAADRAARRGLITVKTSSSRWPETP
ncbi:hypothetical protein ADK43_10450 [Streptomyces rimosus subsp. rimosus]|nr:hypothetical protein ADK43_10450 [Streptomyces rimosus subsp. rimosus]